MNILKQKYHQSNSIISTTSQNLENNSDIVKSEIHPFSDNIYNASSPVELQPVIGIEDENKENNALVVPIVDDFSDKPIISSLFPDRRVVHRKTHPHIRTRELTTMFQNAMQQREHFSEWISCGNRLNATFRASGRLLGRYWMRARDALESARNYLAAALLSLRIKWRIAQ
jgi:hypothetical protein